jgi:DNA-damage-inducible protein J
MASSDVVRARINGHIKEEASNVLAQMGLSVSDAIRMLLTRVAVDKALPFDVNGATPQGGHSVVAGRRSEKKNNE